MRTGRRHRLIVRCLRLALTVGRDRVSQAKLRALAVQYDVCPRTIRRDLAALRAAGFPVQIVSEHDVEASA